MTNGYPRGDQEGDVSEVAGLAGMLCVDDGGAGGIPVVLIHSFGGSSAQWAAQLEHLRKTRRAIAFDLRGHGRSDAPADGDYAIASLAGDAGAVLDALSLPRVVLVGHSLGAAVAIEYAGGHAARVAGLLLNGAPARLPRERADRVMVAMESDYEGTSAAFTARLLEAARPAVRAVITRDSERISPAAAMAIIRATFKYDPLPALERYRGPKQAVTTPGGDTPFDLHNLVADLPRTEIRGTSHWLQMDEPDQFDRIMDRFLQRLDSASRRPAARR
jgi:pimeloyl-ACP methyl ester carboxylesterase